MEKNIENLSKGLEEAIAAIKQEAKSAMSNGANRDVVDYYDDLALKLTCILEENKLAPLEIREAMRYISQCESDIGFMGSPQYEVKKKQVEDYHNKRAKPIDKLSSLTESDWKKAKEFPSYAASNIEVKDIVVQTKEFVLSFSGLPKQIEVAKMLNDLFHNFLVNPESYVPRYLGSQDSIKYMEKIEVKGKLVRAFTKDFVDTH